MGSAPATRASRRTAQPVTARFLAMEMETRATQRSDGTGWIDHLGFSGPFQPGTGPRSDPASAFPTGPAIGEHLPAIVGTDQHGNRIDVHEHRNGRPLVVVFFRSAVW